MIYNLIIDLIVNGIMLAAGILILRAVFRIWERWVNLCLHDRIALNPVYPDLKEGGPASSESMYKICLPPDRSGSLRGAPCGV